MNRAGGVIFDRAQNRVLLLRRVKDGAEYFCFPGGGVEDGETPAEAAQRELEEETGLEVELGGLLMETGNQGRKEYYYAVTDWKGETSLGGPEAARQGPENQYNLEWVPVAQAAELSNLYPAAMRGLLELFARQHH